MQILQDDVNGKCFQTDLTDRPPLKLNSRQHGHQTTSCISAEPLDDRCYKICGFISYEVKLI